MIVKVPLPEPWASLNKMLAQAQANISSDNENDGVQLRLNHLHNNQGFLLFVELQNVIVVLLPVSFCSRKQRKRRGKSMGGMDHGHGEDFRTKVWSMTGGPNCRPKHWKRNTAIAMFGVFLICIPIAMKSAELEVSLFHSLLLAVNQFIIVNDFESLGVICF